MFLSRCVSGAHRVFKTAILGGAMALGALDANAQALKVYLSPPKVEATDRGASAITENFDAMPLHSDADSNPWAIGTATALGDPYYSWIEAANDFGGAQGVGHFVYPGMDGLSIQLLAGSQYLGFWWSAVDPGNRVRVFDSSDNLLVELTGADFLAEMTSPDPTFSSMGGAVYQKSDYMGNPRTLGNPGEPYAYVNLLLESTPLTFGRIEISGDRFEIDNISIVTGPSGGASTDWVDLLEKPLIMPPGSLTVADDHGAILVKLSRCSSCL